MSRLIEPQDNEATPVGSKTSRYAEAVAKYVPAEIVGGYLPLTKLLASMPPDGVRVGLEWFLFVSGLAITPMYLIYVHKPSAAQMREVWISTVAFVLWAAALGEPFARLPILRDHGYVTGFLLGLFTWTVGFFPPRKRVRTASKSAT
jgi:hypothetical protein